MDEVWLPIAAVSGKSIQGGRLRGACLMATERDDHLGGHITRHLQATLTSEVERLHLERENNIFNSAGRLFLSMKSQRPPVL